MKEKMLYALGYIVTAIYLVIPVTLFAITAAYADPLAGIVIEPEQDGGYSRASFGSWHDEDGDGQKTRDEVLIDESLVPVTLSPDGRKVLTGLWLCPFTGLMFSTPKEDPDKSYAWLQIDHMVPLSEAYRSGAHNWSSAKRRAYYNDMSNPGHLLAVHGPANQAKSDNGPEDWMPSNTDFHCAYALTWIGIKREWGLAMDDDEAQALRTTLSTCDIN